MQVLCGLQGIFLLFNCQTPVSYVQNMLLLCKKYEEIMTFIPDTAI